MTEHIARYSSESGEEKIFTYDVSNTIVHSFDLYNLLMIEVCGQLSVQKVDLCLLMFW